MAQFARPFSDLLRGTWLTGTNGTSNLGLTLDEEIQDDTDFIVSSTGTNDSCEFLLSSVSAPTLSRLHLLRYRGKKSQAAGNQRGVTVEVRQGTIVISSNSHPDLTAISLDGTILLTRAQASTIINYSDLRVRFTSTGVISGAGSVRRSVQISWAQLRIPDDFDLIDDLISRWGVVLDESIPGIVIATLNGISGVGVRRVDALVDLRTKLRDAVPADVTNDRRWHLAYYLRKRIDYAALRATLTDSVDIARCDAKLAGFVAIVRQADAGEAE